MTVALALVAAALARPAPLPSLPPRWPRTLQVGLTDDGSAAALRRRVRVGFRYTYLAGGVNTGQGWATWRPNGGFASAYVRDSWARGIVPVLTYYMLLQSKPTGGDEGAADLAHLRSPALMAAYWDDVRLLFARVRGTKPVVVHVEPDLWGYLEQAGATGLASSFAREWVQLRNRLAPNVLLAYHMSGWGTRHDIVYEDPPDATVRAFAARSAAFYRALGVRFDVAFEDFSDRDAGFYAKVEGNPRTWFKPADFHRHLLYAQTFVGLARVRIAAWQIPLGNTVMRASNDTRGHYQDNRVQWLLGPQSRTHLAAYVRAGFVGFLFGGGGDGSTCACDAQHDGVTNPPPIDGNTRRSLNADDDGGYFRAQVGAYYRRGAVGLP